MHYYIAYGASSSESVVGGTSLDPSYVYIIEKKENS